MGLAAPRQRNKIGADPNNTKWSKSTDRFGHKILTSQGWKPGDTLGAENASHASHYTSASSSHIRVLLREDNLGLGAKNGKQDADKFGLDMFQGLLGRLNGKSEQVLEKEAGYRRDLRLKEMVVKRFGGTTFVSGGYLVGDKMERSMSAEVTQADCVVVKERKSKKRKRPAEEGDFENSAQLVVISSSQEPVPKQEKRKSKKEKRVQEHQDDSKERAEADEEAAAQGSDTATELSEKELKRQRKAERRAAKEARKQARAEKKRKRREDELKDDAISMSTTPIETSETEAASSDATKSTGLQKTAAIPRGRFAVRSRYAEQKRMAASDQQALKEIFMIQAEA